MEQPPCLQLCQHNDAFKAKHGIYSAQLSSFSSLLAFSRANQKHQKHFAHIQITSNFPTVIDTRFNFWRCYVLPVCVIWFTQACCGLFYIRTLVFTSVDICIGFTCSFGNPPRSLPKLSSDPSLGSRTRYLSKGGEY